MSETKDEAIRLRKRGFSYNVIANRLDITAVEAWNFVNADKVAARVAKKGRAS